MRRLSLDLELLVLLPLLLAPLACGRTSPLPTKEALVAWTILLSLGLWAGLRFSRRLYRWNSTPMDWPVFALWLIAGTGLIFHRDAWVLRLRDFGLFTLMLVYAKILAVVLSNSKYRKSALRLVVFSIGIVAGIAFLMDQGIYFYVFYPVVLATENARHTIASTIGHNSSVASLLSVGVFYSLALIFSQKNRFSRTLGYTTLLLSLYGMVASRTVAVWLIFPVLVIFMGVMIRLRDNIQEDADRWRKWIWKFTGGLLGLLIIIVFLISMKSQTGSTLLTRLERLRPEVLLQGTRLRLWNTGTLMVRENPFGVGFSGFKYEYPDYQGLYFEKYPDSSLSPTSLLPGCAHNEYLQVAIETGWPGVVVLLWIGIVFLKWIRTLLRENQNKTGIISIFILCALFSVILHNLVNFEFHVISSATLFLFGWAFLEGSMQNPERSFPGPKKRNRIGWLITFLFIASALAVQLPAVRGFQAEEFFRQGHHLRQKAYKLGETQNRQGQMDYYRMAAKSLETAFVLAPYQGDFAYYAAGCWKEIGRMNSSIRRWESAKEQYQSALAFYRKAEYTIRSVSLLRDRAETRMLLGRIEEQLENPDQAHRYYYQAESDLKEALHINPRDTRLVYLLGYYYLQLGNRDQALSLWRETVDRLPQFLDQELAAEVQRYENQERYREDWDLCQLAIEVDPDKLFFYWEASSISFALGREEQEQILQQTLEAIEHQLGFHYGLFMLSARQYFQMGDRGKAERQLDRLLEKAPLNVNAFLMKCDILERTGRGQEAFQLLKQRLARVKGVSPQTWKLYLRMAQRIDTYQGSEDAIDYLNKLAVHPWFQENPFYLQEIQKLKLALQENK